MNSFLEISGRKVGLEYPPLVIAEIGINHGGSLDVAIEMADCAIRNGAEVVKHQTHIPHDEMSKEARQVVPGNSDVSIDQIIRTCALDESSEYVLMQHVVAKGAIYISTPFSRAAVARLAKFNVPAFKIGSGECSNYPFIAHVARLGRPMIVSTGMHDISAIRPSVEIMRKYHVKFALLHCTNVYPTPPEIIRLNAILELREAFPDAVVGLSDHSLTNYPCIAAVTFGASILERHFTDSRNRIGPDISCSMTGEELSELRRASQLVHSALGGSKSAVAEEYPTIAFALASVATVTKIKAGERFTEKNIFPMRPNGGDFSPAKYEWLIGRTAAVDLEAHVQLKYGDVE